MPKILNPKLLGPEASKLKDFLEKNIVKQRMAINKIAGAYNLYLSPLRNIHPRPIFSGFFTGPSGVGKTLLAQLLAEYFYGKRDAFIKVDCPNYSQEHELSQLIGAPAGYVGHYDSETGEGTPPILSQSNIEKFFVEKTINTEEGKKLQKWQDRLNAEIKAAKESGDRVALISLEIERSKFNSEVIKFWAKANYDENGKRTKPISIILFDEIDKASPSLHNFLLPVLDSGETTLKDNESVSFLASFIIMTSNAGSRELAKNTIGFATSKDNSKKGTFHIAQEELRRMFRPEFIGRIKENIVYFENLDHGDMMRILRSNLTVMHNQLLEAKFPILVIIPDDVREYVLKEATDHPEYGARMISQKLEDLIRQPLANLIASGQIIEKDEIVVSLGEKKESGKYDIQFTKI